VSKERHVVALSGGKDSAALAVYLRQKNPHLNLEYVFTDSGCELPETYEYLDKIRAVLNIDITVIKPEKGWDDYWTLVKVKKTPYGIFTYLPSPQQRWCTEVLKLVPYERWIARAFPDCIVNSYVGLRADEADDRKGLITQNPNLRVRFPFIEDGLIFEDIQELLICSGLGFPAYYSWRKRSGCYFCFYQSKKEWLGLHEHHPDLYYRAMEYETYLPEKGVVFTWCQGISLRELLKRQDEFAISAEDEEFDIGLSASSTYKLIKILSHINLKGGSNNST
jgi:hypothetical protein